MITINQYFRATLSFVATCSLFVLSSLNPSYAVQLVSQWKTQNIVIDGMNRNEWKPSSTAIILQRGWIQAQNDYHHLYLFIDLGGDTYRDTPKKKAPWGDYIRISIDVNRDAQITPKVDLAYALFPGSYRVGKQYYLGAGRSTGLNKTQSRIATSFTRSLNVPLPHRMWEVSIPLKEIRAKAGGLIRIGVQMHSEKPNFNLSSPANHQKSFSRLIQIQLATKRGVLKPDFSKLILLPPAKAKLTQAGQGGCKSTSDNNNDTNPVPISSTITPAGHVITRYSNGKTIERYPGGKKITLPNGEVQLQSYSTHAPVAVQPSLPDQSQENWLDDHNTTLLNIIKTMVNYDADAIQHYQEFEGEGTTLYQQIEKRADTINYLSSP